MSDRSPSLAKILLLALVCYATGSIAWLTKSAEFGMFVWPPTGIALAGLLLLGIRAWPAVWLSAFLIHVEILAGSVQWEGTARSLSLAAVIGSGATAQALTGAWLVRYFLSEVPSFKNLKEVFVLFVFGVLFGSIVGAAVQAAIPFCFSVDAHVSPLFWNAWRVNVGGGSVFAPFVLALACAPTRKVLQLHTPRRLFEAAVLFLALPMCIIFLTTRETNFTCILLCFLFLAWATLRWGTTGIAVAMLVIAMLLVWNLWSGDALLGSIRPSKVWRLLDAQAVLGGLGFLFWVLAGVQQDRSLILTELQRTRTMLELLFEKSPGSAVVVDQEGRIVRINAGTEKTFGYQREELLGQKIEMLVPDEAKETHVRLRESYMSNPVARPMAVDTELSGQRRDGTSFPVQVLLAPIDTPEGLLILSMTIDLTERRSLEEQLRQAQKMEAIGRLAGGVAHDFNNLLTIINGYCSVLLEQEHDPRIARGMIEQINHAGERAASLTQQLLAYSRKQILQPRVLDLNELIRNTEKMLVRMIREDIKLVVSFANTPCHVRVDPGQLEQVLMNLAGNSQDAMPQGGKLTIGIAPTQLGDEDKAEFAEVNPGFYAILSVTDDGCGMDKETLSHIFEPFFTTKELGKGTGLGLATVYGIVKQTGGHLQVESEPGKGTTFRVYLPLLEVEQDKAMSPDLVSAVPRGTETLLLVEDEQGVRKLTSYFLTSAGYRVIEAADGVEALEIARRQERPIDLLITDVVMPRMGGRELADKIRSFSPEMKVMFVSGYTDDRILRDGILEAASTLLQKPYSMRNLAHTIRQVLEQNASDPVQHV